MATQVQSLLQQGFSGLKFERRVLENDVAVFETFPLDNKLWISFRLKAAGTSFTNVLEKEYLTASAFLSEPMKTCFFEGKAHSFLLMKQPLHYYVMNRPALTAA